MLATGLATPALAAQDGGHDHDRVYGPLANATVSFGAWGRTSPLDRFPNLSPIPANVHELMPHEARIQAGGSVNFIIAGFHHVLVYAPGTTIDDINAGLTIPMPGAPPGFPEVVNDPVNRVYRGLSPFGLPQDRVEVVSFPNPGRHLVVCGFVPHFNDRMFGFVMVLP